MLFFIGKVMDVEVKTIDGQVYRFTDVYGIETNETSKIVLYIIKNGVEKAFTFMKHQLVYVYTTPTDDETEEEK